MNTSLGWLAFGRVRDHPLSTRSIAHRIEPCRTLIFDLSPEDVVTRRREAERISASGTPLSVHGLAAHICLMKQVPQRSCGDCGTPETERLSAGSSKVLPGCRDDCGCVGTDTDGCCERRNDFGCYPQYGKYHDRTSQILRSNSNGTTLYIWGFMARVWPATGCPWRVYK
jgi:hypothetical protein